ncbi:hypothetical protein BB560_003344, partial [Smittium megazygosporum]
MKAFKNLVILSLAGAVAAQDLSAVNQQCINIICGNDMNDRECVDRCINNADAVAVLIQQNSACILDCNNRLPAGVELISCVQGSTSSTGSATTDSSSTTSTSNSSSSSTTSSSNSSTTTINSSTTTTSSTSATSTTE